MTLYKAYENGFKTKTILHYSTKALICQRKILPIDFRRVFSSFFTPKNEVGKLNPHAAHLLFDGFVGTV